MHVCGYMLHSTQDKYSVFMNFFFDLIRLRPKRSAPASQFAQSTDFPAGTSNGDIERPWIVVECGYPVVSVAFGSGTPEETFGPNVRRSKGCWTRFDFTKEIILATGHTNGRIRIWNVKTGNLLLELMDHKSAVRDISFAPDGSLRLISASLDKTLKVWRIKMILPLRKIQFCKDFHVNF